MKVWLNISNLCVRVQYYCNGQIPKWAKANRAFKWLSMKAKWAHYPLEISRAALVAQEKILFLANWPISFDQDGWILALFFFAFFWPAKPPVLLQDSPGLELNPLDSRWVAKIIRQLTWSISDLNKNNNNDNNNNNDYKNNNININFILMTLILKIPKFADIQKIIFFVQYEF